MKTTMFQEEIMNDQDIPEMVQNGKINGNGLMVEVFDEEESFKDLSMYWKDLAIRTNATIYMSHEWAHSWWKHFGKNSRRSLFILTIWNGMKLVGLAPFYKGYSSIGSQVVESRLQLIGSGGSPNEQFGYLDDYGISDFLDVLVDDEYKEKVSGLLAKIIDSGHLGVDVINFHQARDDSFVMNHLYPELEKRGLEITAEQTDTCPYIDVSDQPSMKEYIKDQKSSARRRIRKTLRATGPEEAFAIEEPESWEEVEEAVETLIQLHQERWNDLGFPGVFYDDRFTSFFRELVKEAYENDWLWFKEAKDKKGVCASRLILCYNGRYFDYISGFDDARDSAKYRPGIGLLINLVQDSIKGDVKRIELLRGEEYYKYDFTDKNFDNWKVSLRLNTKPSLVRKPVRKVFDLIAFGYKRISTEVELMKVQYDKGGIINMITGYASFRWKSIKLKLED